MNEIGSEFWEQYEVDKSEKRKNVEYLLSGRTALDFIIKDIQNESMAKKAFLPSYCCESMIQPFIDNGILVDFYDVDSNGINYQYENDADIVLLLDFFGYVMEENITIAKNEKSSGKKIIYDSTHMLNGNKCVECNCDYSFCSYRKWFYCNYAKVTKHTGEFSCNEEFLLNKEYVELRNYAANIKKQYIEKEDIVKTEFLSRFYLAEELLEKDYRNRCGIPVKAPICEIVFKRRENALYLINKLLLNKNVRLFKTKVNENDSPLFVPILVSEKDRRELQKFLAQKGIYCPVHWPKTSLQTKDSNLYQQELSLICDQRYTIEDMKRIVSEINNYYRS